MVKTGDVDEGCISIGPWGGSRGETWAYKADSRATNIILQYGSVIDSISFQDESWDGYSLESPSDRFGGPGGHLTDKICIDGAVEYLTTISMTFGHFNGQSVINSISFRTNLTKYGPFGSKSGTSISIPTEGGVICGFHGRAGNYLNAIGIYLAPKIGSILPIGGLEFVPANFKFEDNKNLGSLTEWPLQFHGRAGNYLNAIGIYLAPKIRSFVLIGGQGSVPANLKVKTCTVDEGCISIGPWGGSRGETWAYKADARVTHIILQYGSVIDSISFQDESWDGYSLGSSSDRFGGPGGHLTDKICIDGAIEHLTTISMTFGVFNGQSVINSISFRTNLTKYGPFGSKSGTSVSIPMEGGVICGFHGRAGNYLNAIGFYLAPKIRSFVPIGGQKSVPTHLKTQSSMNLFVPKNLGPWGAQHGRHWDDGVFLAIKQVILRTGYVETAANSVDYYGITPGNMVIHGIQFEYKQRDRQPFRSPWHGSPSGGQLHKIELDSAAGEVIVAIEGFYGPAKGADGFEVITSVTIYTDKRKYGPFGGNELGTRFASTRSGGKVVGFFGRSGSYLNAIGLHMEYS